MISVEEIRRRLNSGSVGVLESGSSRACVRAREGFPTFTTPLRSTRPVYTRSEFQSATSRVIEIGHHAVAWCLYRASSYWDGPGRGWTYQDHDYAAAIDLLRGINAKTQHR